MKTLLAVSAALLFTIATGAETYQQAMKAGHQNRSKRKYTEAAKDFERASKLAANQPAKYNAAFYKGVVLGQAGKYADAVAMLSKAYEIAPKNSKAYCAYYLGYYLYITKKYDQAIEMINKSKTKRQSDIERADYILARIYIRQKKYKEAYDIAITLTKSKVKSTVFQAWNSCAEAAGGLKDKAKYKNAVDKMFEFQGSNAGYRFTTLRHAFNYYCWIEKNYDKALEIADQIEKAKGFSKNYAAHGTYYKVIVYGRTNKNDLRNKEWLKLEKCGVAYFENLAKKALKRK